MAFITNQLNHERVALFSSARSRTPARRRRMGPDTKLATDAGHRPGVGAGAPPRVHAKVEVLKLMNWRIAWGVGKGLNPSTLRRRRSRI